MELPLDALPDAALVAALIQGNQRAASVIWRRHAAAVRRMLQRSLGPDQEIEDLLQDVFMGFVRSAAKLEDRSTLRAYLVSIAFRTAAMEIRRRKVRRWVSLTRDGEMPDAPTAHGEPDDRRALRALHQILDKFSARDRLVFIARHVEGLQIEETAAALKLSKATVWRVGKSSLERVLAEARKNELLVEYVERIVKGQQP
jgi:RNA polymerase sigma-70 factor (ECF subfamily)